MVGMDAWMDEQMDELMDAWMDGWMDGQMDRWMIRKSLGFVEGILGSGRHSTTSHVILSKSHPLSAS